MSKEKKISARKVKRFIATTLLLTGIVALLIAARQKQAQDTIQELVITLKNEGKEENFLRKDDVADLLTKAGVVLKQQTIASINVDEIENIVRSNPWVKDAEVFVDSKLRLNIEVVQRVPVARVFTDKGKSFYLDEDGYEMPLSERYAYSVPVFTNFRQSGNDSAYESGIASIACLSRYIKQDSFWNAQITQVDMTANNQFELYTTLGAQKIKFGDTTNIEQKLNNLLAFYKEVANKIGWDRYELLDIRFKGQVVASPSLGWVPPKEPAKEETEATKTDSIMVAQSEQKEH